MLVIIMCSNVCSIAPVVVAAASSGCQILRCCFWVDYFVVTRLAGFRSCSIMLLSIGGLSFTFELDSCSGDVELLFSFMHFIADFLFGSWLNKPRPRVAHMFLMYTAPIVKLSFFLSFLLCCQLTKHVAYDQSPGPAPPP